MTRLFMALIILTTAFAARAGDYLYWEKIEDLHPTQFTVGLAYVQLKEQEILEMSKKERHKYLEKHPIPVVRGPGGELYMIDHHHLSRAVKDAGYRHVYVDIVEDMSHLTRSKFVERMQKKGYLYLYDSENRERPFDELGETVMDLQDDPYRGLAGIVRDEGGFEKTAVPFTEFQWANFFRSRIEKSEIQFHLKRAVRAALEHAEQPDAQLLPGYLGRFSCRALFK